MIRNYEMGMVYFIMIWMIVFSLCIEVGVL